MPRYRGNKFRNWYDGTSARCAAWFSRALARRRRREQLASESRRRNRTK